MQITTLLQEEDPKTDPETEIVTMAIKPIKMKGIQVMIRNKDQEVEEEKQAIIEEDQMREETHKDPMNQETEAPALTSQDQTAEKTKETQTTTETDHLVMGNRDQIVKPEAEIMKEEVITTKE